MGYQVENYSLNELHRIAVPGTVAPSLFWALPVGAWGSQELNWMWSWFTDRQSLCNDYGLLLVKKPGQREDQTANVSLESLGAKLSDLVPAGVEKFVFPSAYAAEPMRVMVLSGGYPQPGWGVLVEWQERDIRRFEDLINRTLKSLLSKDAQEDLQGFKKAAQTFHFWQNLRRPTSPDLSTMEKEILAGERIDQFLREGQAALQAGEYKLVGERLIAVMQGIGQAAWLNLSGEALQSLLDTQGKLLTAASVLAVSEEVHTTEIEPQLKPLLADPGKRQDVFRNLSSDAVKHALKACLHLLTKGLVEEAGGLRSWANQVLQEVPAPLEANLEEFRKEAEAKLVTRRGTKAQAEHEHQVSLENWRKQSKAAREAYHAAAEKSAELQWQLGPQFLVALEKACREEGLWVRSIPWDPARMIGWKIMASQVKLDSRDLQIATQELAPDAKGAVASSGTPNGVADGSYFTDYVHHIAISKPGYSPWTVTRDLLARLLRPAEMMSLIQENSTALPMPANASLLAEQALHALGWRHTDDVRARPLAGCINDGGENGPVIAGDLSGNDLRIAAESFCKDVVDVVVSQLGYRHRQVWTVIEERIPTYRPTSQTGDWDEEVRNMTLGPAKMILSALGPLAFSAQAQEVSEFVSDLGKLADLLNAASHDREGEPVSTEWITRAPVLIGQLLAKAEAFLGDLPWHMEASFVYGEQPRVLSGEAWSHGSPTPRLLRVIVWTGASPGTHVTFWNKERRNPVVPDPVFITRPRKRQ